MANPASFPILLIDDDPHLVDLFNQASKDNFPQARYTQVYSVQEAKRYLSTCQGPGPKLIFLDINFKDTLTGFDLLAFLRADIQTRNLPVVMLTVSEEAADVQTAYRYGAASFVRKPDTLAEWKTYVGNLRLYWVDTVTLPTTPRYYNE
jgi:CheY-like chemotaxis protein